MKKLIFLFVFVIIALNLIAQNPLRDGQLMIGNGYFHPYKIKGDGGWRYLEARWLPYKNQDLLSLGPYFIVIEVSSKIAGFKYHSTEIGGGLAANFTFEPGYEKEKYGWLNLAYKKMASEGSIVKQNGKYQNEQKDKMLFVSGGMLFKKIIFEEFFPQQKLMFEAQYTLESQQKAKWNIDSLVSQPYSKERLKFQFENGIKALYLNWDQSLCLLPSIITTYSYERGNKTNFFHIGLSLILLKSQYGYEILNVSYQSKIPLKSKVEKFDILEIHMNLINIFRNQ